MPSVSTLQLLILNSIEPVERQNVILEELRKHDGKRLTKRHEDKLKAVTGDDSVCISHQFGSTTICWGPYNPVVDCPVPHGRLYLSNQDKNVVIDVADILERNPAYFAACDARNAIRRSVCDNPAKLGKLTEAIENFLEAKKALNEILGDEDFDPDRHKICEKLIENHKIWG